MFYVLLFSLLAVLLVVAGMTARNRQREQVDDPHHAEPHHATTKGQRKQRSRQRAQSRKDRRKRH